MLRPTVCELVPTLEVTLIPFDTFSWAKDEAPREKDRERSTESSFTTNIVYAAPSHPAPKSTKDASADPPLQAVTTGG